MKKITVALFLGFMGLVPMSHSASPNLSSILSSSTTIIACECTFCTDDGAENNRHNMQHIHFASWEGYLETVKTLIAQEPALVNARDYRGMTPLLFAARAGDYDMVELLLESGADYVMYDNNQSTQTPGGNALHHLFYGLEPSDNLEYTTTIDDIYDLLIEAGTSPYLEDSNGQTPADIYNEFISHYKLNEFDDESIEEHKENYSEHEFIEDTQFAEPVSTYQETTIVNQAAAPAQQSFVACTPTEIMSNAPATVNGAPQAHQSVTECSPTEIMSHQRQEQPFIPHLIFEGLMPDHDSIDSYGSDQSLSLYSIYSYDSGDERIENNGSDKENISSYTSSSS